MSVSKSQHIVMQREVGVRDASHIWFFAQSGCKTSSHADTLLTHGRSLVGERECRSTSIADFRRRQAWAVVDDQVAVVGDVEEGAVAVAVAAAGCAVPVPDEGHAQVPGFLLGADCAAVLIRYQV